MFRDIFNVEINWEAMSAIGTIVAAAVALFLPARTIKKEWSRQDRIRNEDMKRIENAKKSVIHEVCSTADRIIAYKKSAIALFSADNVYHVGFEAMIRIHENTKSLLEMLEILKVRTELSDGALYVAVSSIRIADAIIAQTVAPDPVYGINWITRKNALAELDSLSDMIEDRNKRVRRHAGLSETSDGANRILDKYVTLADGIKASRVADDGARNLKVTDEYY